MLNHKYNSLFTTKAQGKSRKTFSVIRDTTSSLDLGYNQAKHTNTTAQIEDFLNKRSKSLTWLTVQGYQNHRASLTTHFFAGQSSRKQRHTLFLIDVDVKKAKGLGSVQGGIDFAKKLTDVPLFENVCYFEPSTGGNGQHGYVFLDKMGWYAADVNHLYKRFQKCLNHLAEGCDIEQVEIKGTLPVISWENNEATVHKTGMLGKLPRLATDEQEEAFRKIQILNIDQLAAWIDKIEKQMPTTKKPVLKVVSSRGSVSGLPIDEDYARESLPKYQQLAGELLGNTEITTFGLGRQKVTTEDVADFLLISEYCTNNMNKDGSLPMDRIKSIWQILFDLELTQRQYDDKRAAAIRNWLDSISAIDWTDKSYVPPTYNNGRKKNGIACKWKLSEAMMWLLEDTREESQKQNIKEVGKEDNLSRNTIKQLTEIYLQDITQTAYSDINRPELRQKIPDYLYSPDEITTLLTLVA